MVSNFKNLVLLFFTINKTTDIKIMVLNLNIIFINIKVRKLIKFFDKALLKTYTKTIYKE